MHTKTIAHEGNSNSGSGKPRRPRALALRQAAIIMARHEIRGLKRFYEAFDHDILLALLLGEIALHNVGALENSRTIVAMNGNGNGATESQEASFHGCVLRPCNAYSIAAATGLPRETVRRKIGRLAELGWVVKRSNGHLYVTEVALDHFGVLLTSQDLPELLQIADQVRGNLDGAGVPVG